MTVFFIIVSIAAPALIALITKGKSRTGMYVALIASIVSNAVIALSPCASLTIWRFTEGLEIIVAADSLSKLFGVLISCVWLLCCAFATKYMDREENAERYFKFCTLAISAVNMIVFSGNFMTFIVGFEAMTLLTMPLVIHEQTKEARIAAMKYLGYSLFGAAITLIDFFALNVYGVSTIFTAGGVLDSAKIVGKENFLRALWLVMVIGFGAKAGMFPLHAWLPTAHPVAPAPASALLSGVITKCGVIGIIRVTYYLFGSDFLNGSWAQTAAIALSLITVFMGSMMALGQKAIKRRLAYSTVSQVSYVLFGLFIMEKAGFNGAILQLTFHMLAKDALFLWAGVMAHDCGFTEISQLRGIGRKMPAVMIGFTIAALSLIGIPPTGGFTSKWFLISGAMAYSNSFVGISGIVTLIVSAILTAGYLLPVTAMAFFPGREDYFTPVIKREPDLRMLVPILVLAIASVVLGVFPNIVTSAISAASSALF